MPVTRHVCTGCQTSIYNVIVDGVRVPIVVNLWAGQPEDTGPILDLNAPGVKVPSFLREMMSTPLATAELCVVCAAKAFGVPLVTAEDDPMQGAGADVTLPTERGAMSEVERRAVMQERTLVALQVARGEAEAPAPGQYLKTQAEFEAYRPLPTPPAPAAPDAPAVSPPASDDAAPAVSAAP